MEDKIKSKSIIDYKPYKRLYVHFECSRDLEEFSRLIGQEFTPETRVIWFPELTAKELMD